MNVKLTLSMYCFPEGILIPYMHGIYWLKHIYNILFVRSITETSRIVIMSRERYIPTFLFDVALTPRSNLPPTRKSAILPEVKEHSLNMNYFSKYVLKVNYFASAQKN